ncbi:hypothetical protein [Psychrobacter lutiphocae]|uniref:hypothetical protein n=1 Tax=Psychrobacter lutiphocae TaxID=540500 RepID=UPI00037B30F4|nr:hypothetical protein [Psychrobacter lutiphocae]
MGHTANEFESKTLATVGEGAIVTSDAITGKDSLAGVNRDVFNTEIIIKDQQTAGLDVNANIDARVFTDAGRTQIVDEQKEIGDNVKKIGAITVTDALKAPAIIAAITDNGNKNPDSQNKSTLDKVKDNITQIGNNNRTGMSDDTANLVATEELIVTGDITNDVVAQDTYKQLASEIASGTDAQNANVYITPDLTESRAGDLGTIVLGSANETTKQDIYLDRGALDRSDSVTVAKGQVEPIVNAPGTINVLNEEIAHTNGQGEASASTMGDLGEIAYNVGKWANSGNIAEAKESIDTTAINNANTAQEQQEMLAANKERLETQQEVGDAFENRQLHPVEADIIELLATDYAQKKGISEVEARKRLTRGALYNIDAGWKQSIDTYLSDTPEKITQYQEAYAYINAVKPTDMDAFDWSNKLYHDYLESEVTQVANPVYDTNGNLILNPELNKEYDTEDSMPSVTLEPITVTADKKQDSKDSEEPEEAYYLDGFNNSFTATAEDFDRQTLFMNKAYENEYTAQLYKQSAKMKYGEDIGLKEAALTTVTNTIIIKPLGAISGIDKAVDSNVELVKRELNKSGSEHFNDLVNASKAVVGSGKEAISNPKQTLDNALDGAKQLKEAATTQWNYRKLKNQQGLPFDTSYKDAQMVGGLATDAVMGGGAGKAAKVGKEGLENLGRNLDNLTPPPAYATASGTPNIHGGATAITGKPKPNSGIGAAETGGAILAVGSNQGSVQELEVGSYKELKDRAVVGDNLEHDYIPSFAALKKAKENELGRQLTNDEQKELYNNATTVELPKDIHISGRTYGGKNTTTQIAKDADDLCKAMTCDLETHRENLINKGYDERDIDVFINKVIERNKEMGIK